MFPTSHVILDEDEFMDAIDSLSGNVLDASIFGISHAFCIQSIIPQIQDF